MKLRKFLTACIEDHRPIQSICAENIERLTPAEFEDLFMEMGMALMALEENDRISEELEKQKAGIEAARAAGESEALHENWELWEKGYEGIHQ